MSRGWTVADELCYAKVKVKVWNVEMADEMNGEILMVGDEKCNEKRRKGA